LPLPGATVVATSSALQGARTTVSGTTGDYVVPMLPPGTYTVKLSIGGHDYSQPLTVRKDPHSGGTETDIQAQTQLSSDLGKAINSAVDAVNQLEYVRAQVQATMRNLPAGDVKQAATELNDKLSDLEMNLVDLRITGGQDGVRYASKLLGKLGYLANGITTTDYRPTDQHVEIAKQLQEQLKAHLSQSCALLHTY